MLLKRLQSVAYDWHSYGRSTIGNRSDIENVKEANLQAFYREYYQPDNAVLLVAGKFDEAKTLALIAEAFGKIAKPTRKLPDEWTVEPTQDGEREFRIRRKGDLQLVAVAYKVPSGLHADSDGISFANHILTDTPTGRLHKALVESGKAAQVFGFPMTGLYPGLHLFGAVVKKGDAVEPVRDELVRIIEGFAAEPATAEEIARARKNFENQFEKTLANHESIGVQLSEYIALGDWRLFFLARDDLPKVDAKAVAKAAGAYYRRDNRTVGLYLPEDNPLRAEIPPAPTVAEVMKDFKGKAEVSVAEAFDPSQANIDARTKRLEFGGVKIALLPKKNRGETVNVAIQLNMGDEKSLFGQKTVAGLAGQMLSRGTTKYSRQQLSDELERLKVSGRVGGTGGSFQTTRPNLEASLRLAAHVLKEPAFPESEFEQLRNQTITSIESQLAEPDARASEALSKHFNAYPRGDWRYSPTLEESIADVKAAKLDDLRRFHREFYGAGAAEIAIVGDFDADRVASLLKELFADWKASKSYARVPVKHGDVAPANLQVLTPDKENAIYLARQNLDLRDDDPDFPALYVANYILGGGAGFDSRLLARLRQKEGVSYAAGSGVSAPSVDRSGTWSIYAIAAPQNMARVETGVREEIARALKDGFTAEELANAKSGIMQQRLQNRAQDGTLAGAWTSLLHLGRTFTFSKAFEDRLASLTVEDVNAALRKHIDPSKVTVVKAGAFK